jgi:hypothetical protein
MKNLSNKDKLLILEALCFASTPDVYADWSKDKEIRMAELSVLLKKEFGISKLKDIKLFHLTTIDTSSASNPEVVKILKDIVPTDK